MKREDLTEAAIYVVIVLIILRLVIVPLYGSLKTKKALVDEYVTTYAKRVDALEKRKSEQKVEQKVEDDKGVLKGLYAKNLPYSSIQSDFLARFIDEATKKGMTVTSFEMPEPTAGKIITEVPVIVRLQGTPLMLKETLKILDGWDKAVRFRQFETASATKTFNVNLTMVLFRVER